MNGRPLAAGCVGQWNLSSRKTRANPWAEVGFSGTFMLEVYRPTDEVRRDLTPERLAFIDRLRRLASGAKA